MFRFLLTKFLVLFFFKKGGKNKFSKRHPVRGPSTLESLEYRALCAVDFSNGVLTIDDPDSQSVVVGAGRAGKVTINGEDTDVRARNVRSINITATNSDGVTVDLSGVDKRSFRALRETVVTTGDGDDIVIGSEAADNIFTGLGDDVIEMTRGRDVLAGGDGDDTFSASQNRGFFYATDAAYYSAGNKGRILDVELIAVDASASRSGVVVFTNDFSGDTDITGSSHADYIITGAGNDLVAGNGGEDYLLTNDGDDTIITNGGFVNAGAGDDVVEASEAETGINIMDEAGNDQYFGSRHNDKIVSLVTDSDDFDVVYGNDGNDTIDWSLAAGGLEAYGDAGNDSILGGTGDTLIRAGEGDDDITVKGSGTILVFGDEGADFIDSTFIVDATYSVFDIDGGYYRDKERLNWALLSEVFTPIFI